MFKGLLPIVLAASSALAQDGQIPLVRRIEIASHIYSDVRTYFAHWSALPGFDLDKEYRAYLEEITTAPDRRAFDVATLRFFAKLHNGHTTFRDEKLFKGSAVGFILRQIDGKWVVLASDNSEIEKGSVVISINGRPVANFVNELTAYVPASSQRAAEMDVFSEGFVWPMQFTVSLESGKTIRVDRGRSGVETNRNADQSTAGKWVASNIAYIQIPSFGNPQIELSAIDSVKRYVTAKTIIIDVRGNSGGSTPERLLNALIGKPWRTFSEITPFHIASFESIAAMPSFMSTNADTYIKGYLSALQGTNHMEMREPALYSSVPTGTQIYAGKLFVLIDSGCASACDDFAAAIKDSRRALLIGENTYGSSGQPYIEDMGDGIWFRVSAKREYFPNGEEFEGVGVTPDINIEMNLTDVKTGSDGVLERAIRLAAQ